jgi:hypothetical protein
MRCAAGAFDERRDGEALAVEVDQNDSSGRVGCAERTTFTDLGAVPRGSSMLPRALTAGPI